MARIRTFIAVAIEDFVRQRAAALQERLALTAPGVKWVETANMHLTLFFLGEVEELDVVPICRIVKEQVKDQPPFSLEFSGIGVFPSVRRPKILWAGIQEGAKELKRIHARLEGPLLELGCYRREERAYAPHLTLGRLTPEDRAEAWAPILAKHATWQGGTTAIQEVLVMSSELHRGGPVYTVMGRAKLASASLVDGGK